MDAAKLIADDLMESIQQIPAEDIVNVFGRGIVKNAWVTSDGKVEDNEIDCSNGGQVGIEFINGTVIVVTNSEWMTIKRINNLTTK